VEQDEHEKDLGRRTGRRAKGGIRVCKSSRRATESPRESHSDSDTEAGGRKNRLYTVCSISPVTCFEGLEPGYLSNAEGYKNGTGAF
jgi:hypothetical protein